MICMYYIVGARVRRITFGVKIKIHVASMLQDLHVRYNYGPGRPKGVEQSRLINSPNPNPDRDVCVEGAGAARDGPSANPERQISAAPGFPTIRGCCPRTTGGSCF